MTTKEYKTIDKPKYNALSIAKYLLSLDKNREYFNDKRMRNRITNVSVVLGRFRLNQMLYLLQIIYYLEHKKKELLFEDKLYAWESGVVVYNVHTHFWKLYHELNQEETKDIDKKTRSFVDKYYKSIKSISNAKLEEFSYSDPAWSQTWTRSLQPDINFTDEENVEVYQRYCSSLFQEARL